MTERDEKVRKILQGLLKVIAGASQIAIDRKADSGIIDFTEPVNQALSQLNALYKPRIEKYPCADCGKLRTKEEGGTTFTVCDECWEKKYPKKPVIDEEKLRQIIKDVVDNNSKVMASMLLPDGEKRIMRDLVSAIAQNPEVIKI